MKMEDYCREVRLLESKYRYLDKLYPKSLLDGFFANCKVYPDDYALMDKVYGQLSVNMGKNKIDDDLMREVIFISVMGNDDSDVEFIKNNPQGCKKCGWCCKHSDSIVVRPDEISKIGSKENLQPFAVAGQEEAYSIILPCSYQKEDNSCRIYKNRPDACKVFPIGFRNGRATVQRSIHCGFIEFFLVNKAAFFVEMLCKKMGRTL